MAYPELIRGDKGEEVRHLQTGLNKVGAMLLVDGDFGGGTERGIRYAQDICGRPQTGEVDDALWRWLEAQPEPCPLLPTNGVAFIAKEETGGLSYYEKVTRWPHYPGVASGITIGVGYDLRFNSTANFRELWSPYLSSEFIDELARDIGRKGSRERAAELHAKGVEVPFKAAWPVFVAKTLPRFYDETEAIYPSLSTLPGLCRAALVSLVFNRGASLVGANRLEMREIRDILASADEPGLGSQQRRNLLSAVEDRIVAMQRLWGPDSGLHYRRQAEANLWRAGLNEA